MNRNDLQRLAAERLEDARVLLEGKRWEFAYYSAGYAVECGLKACVLTRMTETGLIFDETLKARECLTHDYLTLVRMAGLYEVLNQRLKSVLEHDAFGQYWGSVLQWKPTSRYEVKSETEAKTLYEAITHPDGVLQWIQKYW